VTEMDDGWVEGIPTVYEPIARSRFEKTKTYPAARGRE
jgi:hypothetical protein